MERNIEYSILIKGILNALVVLRRICFSFDGSYNSDIQYQMFLLSRRAVKGNFVLGLFLYQHYYHKVKEIMKLECKDLIKNSSLDFANTLNKIIENYDESINYSVRNIQCNLLDYRHLKEDIRHDVDFIPLFENFDDLALTLYIFEVVSNNSTIEIKKSFTDYSNSKKRSRSVPAFYKNTKESKFLYVGKSQRGFWGRLICHLGVGVDERWHGLQLLHWAKNINLELNLHVYQFNEGFMTNNLLRAMEKDLAEKLKPIIGKHKL